MGHFSELDKTYETLLYTFHNKYQIFNETLGNFMSKCLTPKQNPVIMQHGFNFRKTEPPRNSVKPPTQVPAINDFVAVRLLGRKGKSYHWFLAQVCISDQT